MKKLLFFSMLLTITMQGMAQDSALIKQPSIGLRLGLMDFKKTVFTEGTTKSAVEFGIQYIDGWTKKIDFVSNLSFSALKYPYYHSLQVPTSSIHEPYASIDFNINYKLLTDDHTIVPYLTAGIGLATDHLSTFTSYAPFGGGLQIKAAQNSFIYVQATYRAETSYLTKTHNNYSASYAFPLKLKSKKAVLPPPPAPVDTDNDGVVDASDKCPTQAGTAKYEGCPVPDTDKDGVDDDHDKCPTQAGTAKYDGCPIPDTDKDGVNDEEDKCPTVAGLTRYNGCPIPDTDKDGVNDEEDKCPTEPGIIANHGCVDIQPLLNEIASNFKFKTGKSIIASKKLNKLDAAIAELNKYKNISVDIIGNTDNVGGKKLNKKLSERRAAIVYAYLVKKGIDANRLVKQGDADNNPISTNKTAKGRAENRRTDMKAKY